MADPQNPPVPHEPPLLTLEEAKAGPAWAKLKSEGHTDADIEEMFRWVTQK